MSCVNAYKNAYEWLRKLQDDLSKNKSLEHLALIVAAVVVGAGLLMYLVEPNVRSWLDGIWYAWVTVTHVGYGDVVPVSLLGRLFGAALILFGIMMFALLTAIVSAALIGRDLVEVKREMSNVEAETHAVEQDESLVLKELARLHARLDALEAKLGEKTQQRRRASK